MSTTFLLGREFAGITLTDSRVFTTNMIDHYARHDDRNNMNETCGWSVPAVSSNPTHPPKSPTLTWLEYERMPDFDVAAIASRLDALLSANQRAYH